MIKGKIFIFGASGHAKVVIDIIERQNVYEIAFLIDDNTTLKGTEIYGYRVLGGKQELIESNIKCGVVAIGVNHARKNVSAWLTKTGFELICAVHPSAQIGRGVVIGAGSVVMAGAVINSDSFIGSGVIVNTRASIDHDCMIGDGVHIAPGVTLCGTVTVGELSFVGAGATVIPNRSIGKQVTVGAGSTVVKDVPDGVTVIGCPAKIHER